MERKLYMQVKEAQKVSLEGTEKASQEVVC